MDLRDALRRALLLDTNLFLVFGVGLLERDLIGSFKRTNAYSPEDFDRLKVLLGQTSRLITTPHVLAEFSNLCFGPLSQCGLSPDALIDAIRGMTELIVSKDEIVDVPELDRLGVTDAAVTLVARREGILVLTDDAMLYEHLLAQECAAVNINHLRSEEFLVQS